MTDTVARLLDYVARDAAFEQASAPGTADAVRADLDAARAGIDQAARSLDAMQGE